MFDEAPSWPPFAHQFDPPRPAWVNTRLALPESRSATFKPNPNGLVTRFEVPGLVHAQLPGEHGSDLAVVTFQLFTADQEWSWTAREQLVAVDYLRRRTGGRRQPHDWR